MTRDKLELLVIDNFLTDPDSIRNFALSIDNWRHHSIFNGNVGWRGYRSVPLQYYENPGLNQISKNILFELRKFFDISHEYDITTFFHLTDLKTKQDCIDSLPYKYHRDENMVLAGIIYLNPILPPFNCGTSVLDPWNDKIVDVKNVYNRFVAYEADIIHAMTDVFGYGLEDSRLTLTFFVHTKDEHILRQIRY
jgi:hypothetical protein